MRSPIPTRLILAVLLSGILFLEFPSRVRAQEEAGDAPLGDIARSLRKKSSPSETVVDNDNLPKVMESAESLRAIRSSPVFSLDPGGKNFRVSSPDVTCSLSFTAKNSSLLSDPLMLDELPRAELSKLDGPATIDGDSLQVSIHNGSSWELREVMIGLTIVRRAEIQEGASYPGQARLIPAAAGSAQTQDSSQKQPDVTLLLRVKGSAAPAATAIFRTSLNFALFPDQDWHWAIVKAKGIAPQVLQEAGVVPNIGAYVSTPSSPGGQMSPLLPPPTKDSAFNPSPTSPDVAIH